MVESSTLLESYLKISKQHSRFKISTLPTDSGQTSAEFVMGYTGEVSHANSSGRSLTCLYTCGWKESDWFVHMWEGSDLFYIKRDWHESLTLHLVEVSSWLHPVHQAFFQSHSHSQVQLESLGWPKGMAHLDVFDRLLQQKVSGALKPISANNIKSVKHLITHQSTIKGHWSLWLHTYQSTTKGHWSLWLHTYQSTTKGHYISVTK